MAPTCVVSRPTDLYGLSSIASTSAAEDDNDPFEAAFRLLSGPDTKSSYHRNPISRSAALMPPKASVQHTIALAVLTRLHQWCRQLIWLTLVCVIGCCGESTKRQNVEREIRRKLTPQANHGIAAGHRPPFRRSKSIAEIEQQVLRFFLIYASVIGQH